MVKVIAGRISILGVCLAMLLAISGCLYPEDQTPGQAVTARGSVMMIQDAVARYKDATGLLPIQNADASIPLYEKFKIDLAKMKRMGYVESIPKTAFENGGTYVFLLIDEETKPLVKLLDLSVYQGIAEVQKKVNAYRSSHSNQNPFGNAVYPGFHYLDFGKLDMPQPKLNSMFSHRPLELMVDDAGKVYADYGIDIAEALKKSQTQPNATEDLRRRLIEQSDFVPVKSPAYRYVNGSPQAAQPSPIS